MAKIKLLILGVVGHEQFVAEAAEGNPPVKALVGEVEISRREFLHEEVKVFG